MTFQAELQNRVGARRIGIRGRGARRPLALSLRHGGQKLLHAYHRFFRQSQESNVLPRVLQTSDRRPPVQQIEELPAINLEETHMQRPPTRGKGRVGQDLKNIPGGQRVESCVLPALPCGVALPSLSPSRPLSALVPHHRKRLS